MRVSFDRDPSHPAPGTVELGPDDALKLTLSLRLPVYRWVLAMRVSGGRALAQTTKIRSLERDGTPWLALRCEP